MPFVDRIIEFLRSNRGERMVLENDQHCVIFRPGGSSSPTKDILTFSQISNMVTEIMPDEMRPGYASGEPITFPYVSPHGPVEIEVTQEDGNLRVLLGEPGTLGLPIQQLPPPEFAP